MDFAFSWNEPHKSGIFLRIKHIQHILLANITTKIKTIACLKGKKPRGKELGQPMSIASLLNIIGV